MCNVVKQRRPSSTDYDIENHAIDYDIENHALVWDLDVVSNGKRWSLTEDLVENETNFGLSSHLATMLKNASNLTIAHQMKHDVFKTNYSNQSELKVCTKLNAKVHFGMTLMNFRDLEEKFNTVIVFDPRKDYDNFCKKGSEADVQAVRFNLLKSFVLARDLFDNKHYNNQLHILTPKKEEIWQHWKLEEIAKIASFKLIDQDPIKIGIEEDIAGRTVTKEMTLFRYNISK
ncbi:hypothetical protein QVD17_09391 [Tagetes erecta]|uniref:Uncharacterized protein n=1 Tax=Tagetes erecta TaxID=13708 RepID=A0AAD8KZ89_TARER|nr:hypothetical protein QVD17_09391 [Tagetes erecta]